MPPRTLAHRSRVIAVAIALGLSACNCSTTTQTVQPILEVTPSALDFGLVAVGQASQPQVVQLQAGSAAQVRISGIAITTLRGGGTPFAEQGTPPVAVTELMQGKISIVFTPAAATTYSGELTFQSNDSKNPQVTVLLSGAGAEPEISVKPTHLGLTAVACPPGATSMACEATGTVTITDLGLVPLQLSVGGVYIGPAPGQTTVPANLKLASQVDTQTVQPDGGMLEVTVVWEPAGVLSPTPDAGVEMDAGEDAGTCVVPSDAGAFDAGAIDAGTVDAGHADAGVTADAGASDAGTLDAGEALGEVGNFLATLVIKSDDPTKPEVDVPIAATGKPVAEPLACVNVLAVDEQTFMTNPQGGSPIPGTAPLPATDWQNTMTASTIHVRPGETISLTSQRTKLNSSGFPEVDTATEASNPCTVDPDSFSLTRTWTLTSQPTLSSAVVTPTLGDTTTLTIDAAGEYTVELVAQNSIGLTSVPAVINIDAIPQDDLFAQLSWPDGPGIDLDIHLLVDQGPGIGTAATNNKHTASMFCFQDCFFYNFAPAWFAGGTPDETPQLLRDDQGTSGLLESINLVKAPPNTSFRVAAQYYAQNGGVSSTIPQITIRHQSIPYGPKGACDTTPFTAPSALTQPNDAWFGVQVSFDANSNITVTGLDGGVFDQSAMFPIPPGSTVPPDFTQPGSTPVGMCP